MNRKLPLLIPVFAVMLGWGIGRYVSPDVAVKNQPVATAAPAKSDKRAEAPVSTEPDETQTLSKKIDALLKKQRETDDTYSIQMDIYKLALTLKSDEFGPAIAQASLGIGSNDYSRSRVCAFSLMGYWAEIDTPAAIKWLEEQSSEKQEFLKPYLLQTMAKKDFDGMLTWLEKQTDSQRSSLILRANPMALIEKVSPKNIDRVAALMESTARLYFFPSEEMGYSPMIHLFSSLAKTAPSDTASRAMALPIGTSRTQALAGVAAGWAAVDPTAARQWAEGIQDAALAASVVPACAKAMAEKDAKGAAEWIASLPDTLANQKTLQNIVKRWANKDSSAALEWVDGFPEGIDTGKYVSGIIDRMFQDDPKLALDTVIKRAENSQPLGTIMQNSWEFRAFNDYIRMQGVSETLETIGRIPNNSTALDAIYTQLIKTAAGRNFNDTSDWLIKQQSNPRKSQALEGLAQQAIQKDSTEALRWVDTLPKGADTDQARQVVADVIFRAEGDAALKIYRQMSDQQNAQELLNNSVRNWLQADPVAANAWLSKTSSLSAGEKASLRQKKGGQ